MTRPKGSKDRRRRRKCRVLPSIETVAERTRRLQLTRDRAQAEARAAIDGVDPGQEVSPGDERRPEPPPGGDDVTTTSDPHPPTPEELERKAREETAGDPEPDDPYTYVYDPHLLRVNLARGSRGFLNAVSPAHRGRGGLNEFDADSCADVVAPVIDKWTRRNSWWLPEIVGGFVLLGIAAERLFEPKEVEDGKGAKPAGSGRASAPPDDRPDA